MSAASSGFVMILTNPGRSPATAGSILSVLLLAASVEGQSPSVAPACYDLELGPWQPFIELEADSIYVAPPPRIFLDTVPGAGLGRPTGYSLTTAPGAIPSIHRLSWWAPAGSDSIEFVWTTGFSGLRARLATTSRPLVGTAETSWDFGRPVQHATITATAISCDAPIREAYAFRYRFPRGIGMESDSILVGKLLRRSSLRL